MLKQHIKRQRDDRDKVGVITEKALFKKRTILGPLGQLPSALIKKGKIPIKITQIIIFGNKDRRPECSEDRKRNTSRKILTGEQCLALKNHIGYSSTIDDMPALVLVVTGFFLSGYFAGQRIFKFDDLVLQFLFAGLKGR